MCSQKGCKGQASSASARRPPTPIPCTLANSVAAAWLFGSCLTILFGVFERRPSSLHEMQAGSEKRKNEEDWGPLRIRQGRECGHTGDQAITQGGEEGAWLARCSPQRRESSGVGCEWGSGSIMGRQISHSKMFPGKPGETLKIYSCSKPGKTNPC